jgi:sigma54-dependent transcription regulator
MVEQGVGPIDYLALEFPQATITGEGMAALLDLVYRGIIRILDLRFAIHNSDGSFVAVALADLDGDGKLDLAVFEGAQSGLLGDEDLVEAAALVAPESAVGVLVYENTWAGKFVSAMRNKGAEVIASGRIPVDDVIAELDRLESANAQQAR